MDSQHMSFHGLISEVCGRKSSTDIDNNHNDTAKSEHTRRKSCRGGGSDNGGGGDGGLWQQVENAAQANRCLATVKRI